METIMENTEKPFREQLLSAQSMTPALREEYRKEMEGILVHKLSPAARMVNGILLLVWVGLAAWCVWGAIKHRASPKATFDWWINLAMYFVVFVLLAAGGVRNALKGEHTWRAYFNVAGMFYTAAGITVTLALLRGLRTPHDPASTFGAVFALVFLVVCLGWALQNRIDAALLSTREHMLRMESRLADLAERMGK
jgi:hypothetical protein